MNRRELMLGVSAFALLPVLGKPTQELRFANGGVVRFMPTDGGSWYSVDEFPVRPFLLQMRHGDGMQSSHTFDTLAEAERFAQLWPDASVRIRCYLPEPEESATFEWDDKSWCYEGGFDSDLSAAVIVDDPDALPE